jgi:hypothetical protein
MLPTILKCIQNFRWMPRGKRPFLRFDSKWMGIIVMDLKYWGCALNLCSSMQGSF